MLLCIEFLAILNGGDPQPVSPSNFPAAAGASRPPTEVRRNVRQAEQLTDSFKVPLPPESILLATPAGLGARSGL